MGSLDGIVLSPPYAESMNQGNKEEGYRKARQRCAAAAGKKIGSGQLAHGSAQYHGSKGNIASLKAGDMETSTTDTIWLDWTQCYGTSWKGMITPASFAHPAKMSRALLSRILKHGLAGGFWKPGDVLGEPFFGVGTTGILGAYEGLRVVGVELEPKFVGFCRDNFALHKQRWEALGAPVPEVIQGDSRKFAELVKASGIITSPPYAEGLSHVKESHASNDMGRKHKIKNAAKLSKSDLAGRDYGTTPGQIGALKTSDVDGVATSPPWEDQAQNHDSKKNYQAMKRVDGSPAGLGASVGCDYGVTDGQIGVQKAEDYWSAMRTVYDQCRLALKPGGVMAVVVKAYVKKGQIVPLPDQTAALLKSLGFTVFLRVRAWLTEEKVEPGLFGDVITTKETKSFFRRLQEKKGSPKIDFEEVLFARRPA